ncbi:MAG: 3-methyladenine DNA glycosylase AlkD [Cryomorphaceae bacterium]|jgi:3-methyladenine DNA glycosylase AlkD
MGTQEYIDLIEEAFRDNAKPEIAKKQSAYMRDQFSYYGIMGGERKELLKPFLRKENRQKKEDLVAVVKSLWRKPEREFQYAAQELSAKYMQESEKKDIELFEWMITTKSWWDTVDYIAATLVGNYFQKFPEEVGHHMKKWLDSDNIWLQRTTLIFQLKYKDQVDTKLLAANVHAFLGTKEFFIDKAIGWALREYGKVNPNWVVDFVDKNELSNLSKREALKRINLG